MYARVLRIGVRVERIDEASKLFEMSVIPQCRNQKGFKGAYFLADRKTGQCLPITFWETEDDMIATERSRFFQEQVIKFIAFFKSPPIREGYEVLVQE